MVQALFDHDKKTFQNGWSRHVALLYAGVSAWANIVEAHDSNIMKDITSNGNVCELLVTQGVDFFTYGRLAPWIQCILMNNSHTVIKKLLAEDPDMCNRRDDSGFTLLHLACMCSDGEVVKLLLDNGADSTVQSEDGLTIIHAAVVNISDSVIRCLLNLDFDPEVPDVYGATAFHWATEMGTESQVSLLVAAECDVSLPGEHGLLPLHYAMSNKNLANSDKILDAIIPLNFGINAEANDSSTPLHIAARYGSISHVRWLVERNANITAIDSEGRTAVHCAAANNNDTAVDILELLISHGLSVLSKDDAGLTPLHNLLHWSRNAYTPHIKSVFRVHKFRAKLRLLLKKKAELNAQDYCGNTVLHLACSQGSRFVVRLLLDEGADTDLRDFNGCRAIDLARRDDIRALLEA